MSWHACSRDCERPDSPSIWSLFVSAVTAGYTNLHAVPVRLGERMSGSTVTSSTILRTLTDALSVLARRHYTDVYNATPEGAPLPSGELPLTLAA